MKIITTTVASVLLAVAPFAVPAVFAQGTTATTATPTATISAVVKSSSSIQATLQAQIAQLMQQIKALQVQIAQIKTTQQTIASSFSALRTQMSVGSRGTSVTVLQRLLASDPSVYPQGLVTGYYGHLTEAAVKKFQENHGIAPVGEVGPETRLLLNSFLKHATSTIPMNFLHKVEGEQRNATSTSTDHMVSVCHRAGNSSISVSQRIARSALFSHIKSGDSVGECQHETNNRHPESQSSSPEGQSLHGEQGKTGDKSGMTTPAGDFGRGSVGENKSTTTSSTTITTSNMYRNHTTSGDMNGN